MKNTFRSNYYHFSILQVDFGMKIPGGLKTIGLKVLRVFHRRRMTGISGGQATRMGGPQVPAPLVM